VNTVPAVVDVRRLRPADLESVIALDARITGRRREEYFRVKLDQALRETGIQVSLAAETDGLFRGFLLCRVYYGEFGAMEPGAVLDTIGVHPEFRGAGIGRALLGQLRTNLLGIGIGVLRTEVPWDNQELLRFLHDAGWTPAARLCLDWDLETSRHEEEVSG
jgi:ribosomal protein S18 acetylase RimI-like enzyme